MSEDLTFDVSLDEHRAFAQKGTRTSMVEAYSAMMNTTTYDDDDTWKVDEYADFLQDNPSRLELSEITLKEVGVVSSELEKRMKAMTQLVQLTKLYSAFENRVIPEHLQALATSMFHYGMELQAVEELELEKERVKQEGVVVGNKDELAEFTKAIFSIFDLEQFVANSSFLERQFRLVGSNELKAVGEVDGWVSGYGLGFEREWIKNLSEGRKIYVSLGKLDTADEPLSRIFVRVGLQVPGEYSLDWIDEVAFSLALKADGRVYNGRVFDRVFNKDDFVRAKQVLDELIPVASKIWAKAVRISDELIPVASKNWAKAVKNEDEK